MMSLQQGSDLTGGEVVDKLSQVGLSIGSDRENARKIIMIERMMERIIERG